MRDLNLRQETIKILEKNTGSNLFDIGHGNFLLDICLEARETSKKKLLGLQDKKLLHSKEYSELN